jgi:hypothetical protein
MKRALEVEVQRKGRPEATYELTADPDDTIALRAFLKDWLESNKWDRGHWGKFSLAVRYAGEWKVRKNIRMGG